MPPPSEALRVLHVIGSLHPSMGGLPKAALSLAAAQALAGARVGILYYGSDLDEEAVHQAFESLPGFSTLTRIRIADLEGCEKLFAKRALQALDSFAPSLIHTHGLWEPLLRHVHARAKAQGIPYVFCPHAMLHPWHMQRRRFAKALVMYPLGWRKYWRNAAFAHVFSLKEEQALHALGLPRTRRVPNGIFPCENLCEEEPELPGIDGQPFVLFLARLHEQKSPDLLLEAFARLAPSRPGLRLVLAGPDYGMQDLLETRVAEHGLEDRVILPGTLQGLAKWTALHLCACFCLPSRAEGFSIALLEAALAASPIVLTAGCHFDELVDAGGARRSALDAESLATEIAALLDDPHAAAHMGHQARAFVLEHYSWDRAARQLLAHYRDVLT